MKKHILLYRKNLSIELSDSAEKQAVILNKPLLAEIHLILGCLVVKRVWFKEHSHAEEKNILGNLNVCFRAVRYSKQCRISHIDSGLEEPSDFPIVADKKAFVPDWLFIDFKKDKWSGKYGYHNKTSAVKAPVESECIVDELILG